MIAAYALPPIETAMYRAAAAAIGHRRPWVIACQIASSALMTDAATSIQRAGIRA